MKPLCIDLFCGLGGWAEGFLAEGYDVIGFDIERHRYPKIQKQWEGSKLPPGNGSASHWKDRKIPRLSGSGTTNVMLSMETCEGWSEYPGQLVLQDVLTLHGSQFRNAAVIVASPPCQAYSYRAMPWKRAKALPPPDNTLFDACFQIQREASEAAGRYIPLVVENVCGAQKWVGRAAWHFGSFYLWGDVPALMPTTLKLKVPGFRFDGSGGSFQTASVNATGVKVAGLNWSGSDRPGYKARAFNTTAEQGLKNGHDWFGSGENSSLQRRQSSKSSARAQASAEIAKIPFDLANHIARVYRPDAIPPDSVCNGVEPLDSGEAFPLRS